MPVVMALAPLLPFGVRKVAIVSMQAISGAGYPGVPSLDIIDNVVPYVGGEEEKLVEEPQKMLGRFNGESIDLLDAVISPSCNRVTVIDGHLVNISVELAAQPSLEDVIDAWNNFRGPAPVPSLPSAPEHSGTLSTAAGSPADAPGSQRRAWHDDFGRTPAP